jgi:putative photosynthetic complex assembly protein 2
MHLHGWPTLFALFVWWFSTGVIIYLDGLPRRTFKWSMLGATALFGAALWGMAASRDDTTLRGAYLAFTCGVLAWGWQEISFYMGYVTGTRREPCAENCAGLAHFGHAIQTSLWHELAIIASAAAVVACTWDGANQLGRWTFMIMWWMHQSAKLNVFLGVRNLNEEFLPEHLRFLRSFLKKRPMNLLFPVSVTVSTVFAAELLGRAFAASATPFDAVGYTFLGGLMVLAILEHWFLVVPLPAAALWNWGLKSRSAVRPAQIEVVTGFLGAGKTTLLRRRLSAVPPGERTIVLVNDFGAVGVDGSLLAGRGADVVELPNGCLCCSLRDDLARQLREIVTRYGPDRVLIEPSGVAESGSLLRTLHRPDLADLVANIRVITVIDARAFLEDYARMPDYFEAQAHAAPVIVLNKADLVTTAALLTIEETLRPINPAARLVRASYGAVDAAVWADAPPIRRPVVDETTAAGEPALHSHADGHGGADGLGFETWSTPLTDCYDEGALRGLLADVAAGEFGRVARSKGIVRARRGWMHFDVAGGGVSLAAFASRPGEQGRGVAIGTGLDRTGLELAFAACAVQALESVSGRAIAV